MYSPLPMLFVFFIFIFFMIFSYLISRYRLCPADKVLVVYGTAEAGRVCKCIHGGGIFVLPII